MIDIIDKYNTDLANNTGETVPPSVLLKETFLESADLNDKELSAKFSAIDGLLLNSDNQVPDFDSVSKTFTIPGFSRIVCGEKVYVIKGSNGAPTSPFVLDISAYSTGIISYDTANNTFDVRPHTTVTIPRDEVVIATYAIYGRTGNMASTFTVNGDNPIQGEINALNESIEANTAKFSAIDGLLLNSSGDTPDFDSVAKTFTVPGFSRIVCGEKVYIIKGNDGSPTSPFVLDISADSTGIISYDTVNNTFDVRPHTTVAIPRDEVVIATYAEYGEFGNMANTFTVNGNNPIRDSKPPEEILSPEYTYVDITSQVTGMWSDFIITGSQYIIFKASSDENHVANDGAVYVVDYDTNILVKTLTHNLGHCNTVHYDSINDKLMIGNLPGSTAHPNALYILNDFSVVLSGTSIDFNTVDKTVVNLSSSSYPVSQIAACFCENNMNKRDIVFIIGDYGSKNMKIQLGTGVNDLGNGDFVSASLGEFNGSFKIIDTYNNELQIGVGDEVTQGISYHNGQIYTSNGHSNIRGTIITLKNNNTIKKQRIVMPVYATDGSVDSVVSEGCDVFNNVMHIGVSHNASAKIVKINI